MPAYVVNWVIYDLNVSALCFENQPAKCPGSRGVNPENAIGELFPEK
jgi:hypothetical protein